MTPTVALEIVLPKWPVGTRFDYRGRDAAVVGYHIEHDTDTSFTDVKYRVEYVFSGQRVSAVVPRSTLDRAKLQEVA